jgi:hypothetical protein
VHRLSKPPAAFRRATAGAGGVPSLPATARGGGGGTGTPGGPAVQAAALDAEAPVCASEAAGEMPLAWLADPESGARVGCGRE